VRPHTSGRPAIMPAICLCAIAITKLAAQPPAESPNDLTIVAGKSALVSSEKPIERISVGFGDIAEATAVSPTEVLVNAKAPGSTSLIIWQQGGGKLFFDLSVQPNKFLANTRLEAVRRELRKELPDQDIALTAEGDFVFLRGQAKDLISVDRAVSIGSTAGKVVNLLYVQIPGREAQILLKVRFASIDRTRAAQLGLNLFSTGGGNTVGTVGTGQFPVPSLQPNQQTTAGANNTASPFVFSDLLNIFLYNKNLNLGTTIKALESKGLLQILAEPNVLTENGKQGSFLAGGEFPIPVVQGSSGAGGTQAITIQYREFGVRLNFIPTLTPRGSIHLQIAPEVSSLDFANAITISGFQVPSLTTRKVNTEVELDEGQSFAIAGLLDRRVTDTFEKVPFIGDIPVLGKFFQSKSTSKTNTELIVIVTPELVQPVPSGAQPLSLAYPKSFLETEPASAVRTPGIDKTGPARAEAVKSVPVEKYIQSLRTQQTLDISGSVGGKTSGSALPANPVNPLPLSQTPVKQQ
jgi:pilus assembly protein CpaC